MEAAVSRMLAKIDREGESAVRTFSRELAAAEPSRSVCSPSNSPAPIRRSLGSTSATRPIRSPVRRRKDRDHDQA